MSIQRPLGESLFARLSSEDVAILARKLLIDQPATLPDIQAKIPSDAGQPEIEYWYEADPKVRCAHCPQHQWHNKGFVLRFSDGRRALLGIDCAELYFNVHWEAFRLDFEAKRDRQNELRMLAALRRALPAFVQYLQSLRTDPQLSRPTKSVDQFRGSMPDLWRQLERVHQKEEGQFVIKRQVRDYAAEDRRKSENTDPIYTTVRDVLGRPPGLSVVMSGLDSDFRVAQLQQRADDLQRLVEAAILAPRSDRPIRVIEQSRSLARDVEKLLADLTAVVGFFQPATFRMLVQWLEHRALEGKYVLERRTLRWFPEPERANSIPFACLDPNGADTGPVAKFLREIDLLPSVEELFAEATANASNKDTHS